jgi:exodeoxyribonuclease III
MHPGDSEYSWVGRTGDGYRYDHAFATPAWQAITGCQYVHEPRSIKPFATLF